MITTKTGNLMNVKQGHIVHGCNAQGVMGSGVALAVKQTYPQAFVDYRKEYETRGLILGKAYPTIVSPDIMVWNAITQENFGGVKRNTSYDAIQTCFEQIEMFIKATHLNRPGFSDQIHIPMIGAARGGGDWEIIKTIIERTVSCPVTLWLPDDTVTTR
jgi:O-acetyl-ADP-ribose deacetylase (regulator of RNase III)